MAGIAFQRVLPRRDHMGDGPVHVGIDEAIASRIGLARIAHPGLDGFRPVEIGPEGGVGLWPVDLIIDQRQVFGVIGLPPDHPLEGPDPAGAVVRGAGKPVDLDHLLRVDDLIGQGVFDLPVEPGVMGHDVLAPFEIALGRQIGVKRLAVGLGESRFVIGLAILQLPGRGPVPDRLGRHSAAREFGDMAGLAGHPVGMVVQLHPDQAGAVRAVAVAAFATGHVAAHSRQAGAAKVMRVHRIARPRDLVFAAQVAGLAGEVQPVAGHVDIDIARRRDQGRTQVTMFHIVAAAAVEMALAAVFPLRHPDRHRRLGQIDRRRQRPGDGLCPLRHGRKRRIARLIVKLGIKRRIGMADKAIDPRRIGGGRDAGVGPAIAGMAGGAARLIAGGIAAKGVDDVLLAQRLPRRGMGIVPAPVQRVHDLIGRLGMAFQAGPGNLGTRSEILFEDLELGMIGGTALARHGRWVSAHLLRQHGRGQEDRNRKERAKICP